MADIAADAYLVVEQAPVVFGGADLTRLPVPARDLGSSAHVVDPGGTSGTKTGQLWPRR